LRAKIDQANIKAYDPAAIPNAKTKSNMSIQPSNSSKAADCCMLVTEWPEFKKLRVSSISANLFR